MATFDLGRVTPLYKGDYNASASYELNDVVLYNGSLYWHVQATATVGILPTDTTVWKLAFADEGVRAEIRGYADNAQASADSALASKSAAATSASNASASASQAALSAQSAQTAKTGATASAQTASTKASEASASAQSAALSAQTATDKATLASQKAAAASESASLATAKATAAATSETNAAASAEAASSSATSASTSASNAQTSATNASTSATQASTSAANASASASQAQEYAEQAEESAAALSDINERLGDLKSDLTAVTEYRHSENYFDKENATLGTYQGTPILTSPMVNVAEGDAFYYFWAQSNAANISSGAIFLVYQYDASGNKTSSEMWKHAYVVQSGIVAVQFVTVQTTASYIMMRKGTDAAYYDEYYDKTEAKDETARNHIELIAEANGDVISTDWKNTIYYANISEWRYTPTRIESSTAIIIERDTQITCADECAFNVKWWISKTVLDSTSFVKESNWIDGGNYVQLKSGDIVTFTLKYADDSAIYPDACKLMRYKMYGQDVLNNSYNSTFHVHNYWENPAKRFTSLFGGSDEVESFLFFTDPHLCEGTGWEFEFKELMGQIQQCYNNTPTTFCINGGDWLGNSDTVADSKNKLGLINGHMKSMFNRHYDLVGNHDTNAQGVERLSNNCLRNLWFRDFEHCYYTFVGQSTKFYCFNTGNELDSLSADNGYGLNQCKWFAQNLLSETMDHIALAMHIIYVNSSHTVDPIPQKIMDIAQAYNNRSTITVDDTSYDFALSTGKIEFAIAGHLHADYSSTINDIPVIVSANVRKDTSVGATFDLVYVDYDNSVVNLVRIGSGSDRTVNLI